jgi:hypothetical protein
MFRTEVVKSKNLRKTAAFKLANTIAFFLLFFIIILTTNILGSDSVIIKWIHEHYSTIVSPILLTLAVAIVIFSMVSSSFIRSPKRLGSIEIDENEIRYLENDEIIETLPIEEISKINFEYYSTRLRSNPAGCMNYLTFFTRKENKTYEIVVGNSMDKASLGEELERLSKKIETQVRYTNLIKKMLKDKDFNF